MAIDSLPVVNGLALLVNVQSLVIFTLPWLAAYS